MRRYALRQIVQLAVAIVGISMLAFSILHAIGDPVTLLLPQNAGKERVRDATTSLLGLDQPIYVQYWKFASRAVQGDFGKSWYADTPAFKLVLERMPPTLYLTTAGLGMALLIAPPLEVSGRAASATPTSSALHPRRRRPGRPCRSSPGIMLIIVFGAPRASSSSGYGGPACPDAAGLPGWRASPTPRCRPRALGRRSRS